jgi:hypothetical protein
MQTKPWWQEWKRENWEWIERPGFEGSWRLKHPNRCTLAAEEASVMRRPPTCRSFGSCHKRERLWNSWFQTDSCEQYVPWCGVWEPVFEFAGPKSDPLVYFSGPASRCQSCHDYTASWLGRYDQPWASSHCCEICSRTGGERHGPWCEASRSSAASPRHRLGHRHSSDDLAVGNCREFEDFRSHARDF